MKKTTDLKKGDTVRSEQGGVGTVVSVREGVWSNGNQAMVTVDWETKFGVSRSRHTHSVLSKVDSVDAEVEDEEGMEIL